MQKVISLNLLVALAAMAGSLSSPAVAAGQDTVSDFRAKMEKWVETRQILSQETSEWEVDRETLEATRDLLGQQKNALEAEIAELKETSTVADDERLELLLNRGEYQRANRSLEDQIRALEEEVLALAPQLPEPLRERLELLLVQIPDDPETTRVPLGQRLMNVLGVLAQAEKFNGTATFVGETRAVGGDQKIQIRTLYWGLGQAIYVDSQGEIAGIGRPGAEGWEFSNEPDLAEQARLLLDIYEGNVDVIRFVRLPVEIR